MKKRQWVANDIQYTAGKSRASWQERIKNISPPFSCLSRTVVKITDAIWDRHGGRNRTTITPSWSHAINLQGFLYLRAIHGVAQKVIFRADRIKISCKNIEQIQIRTKNFRGTFTKYFTTQSEYVKAYQNPPPCNDHQPEKLLPSHWHMSCQDLATCELTCMKMCLKVNGYLSDSDSSLHKCNKMMHQTDE